MRQYLLNHRVKCPGNPGIVSRMSVLGILIALIALSPGSVSACSDTNCPPPLTALIGDTSALGCADGVGNAILNPYNDSRINLLLAMTRPAQNQAIGNTNGFNWDFASNPIKSPFYITAFEFSDDKEDDRKDHEEFVKLLGRLGIKDSAPKLNPGRTDSDSAIPDLPFLAQRALKIDKIIQSDTALSNQDRNNILRFLLKAGPRKVSANSRDYFDYITAANAFHESSYDNAKRQFSKLANAKTAWVKEASVYNLIRIEILKTQMESTDRYGFFEISKANKAQAKKILLAIDRYLGEYPKGLYFNSARDLKRRAYWLLQDSKNLVTCYGEAADTVHDKNDFSEAADLAMEIDRIYLFDNLNQTAWNSPAIAAAQILIRLRKPKPNINKDSPYNPVRLEEIKLHKKDFEKHGQLSLYKYLLTAYAFFKDEKYEEVLRQTEDWRDNLSQGDYAAFSRAALRAHALDKLKRWQDAAYLLGELRKIAPSPLLKDHFELAQAQNLETSGNRRKIVEPDSIIQSPVLRRRLLRSAADTQLLEYVLDQKHTTREEKSIALATLLQKELFSKRYKSLLDHQKRYAALQLNDIDGLNILRNETINSPDHFACPKWSEVLEDLSGGKAASHALLCVGERLRTLEDNGIELPQPYTNELGNSDDGFKNKNLTRLPLYLSVIDDPSADYDDKAFALRRLLYCFATSGYNHCGTEDIPVEKRKAWFHQLKSQYGKSVWARKQKYYW